MSHCVLRFEFSLPNETAMDSLGEVLQKTLGFVNAVARTRLSRQAASKAVTLRAELADRAPTEEGEEQAKSAHELRMEHAQKLREQRLAEQERKLREMRSGKAGKMLRKQEAKRRKPKLKMQRA